MNHTNNQLKEPRRGQVGIRQYGFTRNSIWRVNVINAIPAIGRCCYYFWVVLLPLILFPVAGRAAEPITKVWETILESANGYSICPGPNGSVLVAGDKGFAGGYLAKIDREGKVVWAKTYDEKLFPTPKSVTPFGSGYLLVGFSKHLTSSNSDSGNFYMLQVDGSGNKIRSDGYGSDREGECGRFGKATPDGGFIVAGSQGGSPGCRSYVVKFNRAGDSEWAKCFGRTDGEMNLGHGQIIDLAKDGGYGLVRTDEDEDTPFIVLDKITGNGEIQWERKFPYKYKGQAWGVKSTKDGGFIVVGDSDSFKGDQEKWVVQTRGYGRLRARQGGRASSIFLAKVDSAGNVQWAKGFGGPCEDYGRGVIETSDSGYLAVGTTCLDDLEGNVEFMKFSGDGKFLWGQVVTNPGRDVGRDVLETAPGEYVLIGNNTRNGTSVIKFRETGR